MDSAEQLKALETYFQLMSMKGIVEVFHAARRAGVLDALAGGEAHGCSPGREVRAVREACLSAPAGP